MTAAELPNQLRWLSACGVRHFQPWYLLTEVEEYASASRQFAAEDVKGRRVFTFARRHDRDDFAGLLIRRGVVTDEVIGFHPVFGGTKHALPVRKRAWDIVTSTHRDVFAFFAGVVLPDARDWASVENAADLEPDWRGPVARPGEEHAPGGSERT